MKKDSNIIIRVDSLLKSNVTKIIADKGYTLSEVVNAFLLDVERRGMLPIFLNKYLPQKPKEGFGHISVGFIKLCIEKIANNQDNQGKIKKAYLFGSYARGEEKPKSDIDIRIETSDTFSLVDLSNFRLDLQSLLNKDVDVVTQDPDKLDPVFYSSIKKDEICLYEYER